MKTLWKPLLYLHRHALPTAARWREDAPQAPRKHAPSTAAKPVPPMLRWRTMMRASLLDG